MDKEKSAKKKERSSSSSSTPISTRSSETAQEIKNLKIANEILANENEELKEKVAESIKSSEFINAKFEELNKKINEEVLTRLNEISKQNTMLMQKNHELEEEIKKERYERNNLEERLYSILNPIEVEKRNTNLELHGMKEEDNENCYEKIKEVLTQITPKPVAVVNCYRFGYKYNKKGERNTRPIFLKFQNKEQRDITFASRSNLKKIEGKTLYLNEDLPPNLRILRGKANAFRKANKFKYLWFKNGNLLLRENEDSKIYKIRMPSDLEKIL